MSREQRSVRLRSLDVRDFRNIERLALELPHDGMVIVGDNGQGKTNLLEAIYYLELMRSMRNARDQDLVRFGSEGFFVAAALESDAPHEISVGFERAGKRKRVRVDGVVPPRLSDALGTVTAALFSPADVELIAGAPSARRRYLDIMLALTSRGYLTSLQRYRAALARRNAALRAVARVPARDSQIAVWEAPLAEEGARIWGARREWVEQSATRFSDLCAAIGETAAVTMRYASALPIGDGAADALAAQLEAQRSLDVKRGVTQAGPHRDDLAIAIGGERIARELRVFGSAGQQRTAAIALRMLEAETFRARRGAAPLFLLDDPFAELDVRRSSRILGLLASAGLGQTLLAVPRASDIPREMTELPRFTMRDGVLSAGSDA